MSNQISCMLLLATKPARCSVCLSSDMTIVLIVVWILRKHLPWALLIRFPSKASTFLLLILSMCLTCSGSQEMLVDFNWTGCSCSHRGTNINCLGSLNFLKVWSSRRAFPSPPRVSSSHLVSEPQGYFLNKHQHSFNDASYTGVYFPST